MTYKVVILPEAEKQAQALDVWWKKNRPASRTSVKVELARLGDRLAVFPKAAPAYRDRPVRYAPLRHTPYYALFEVDDAVREVRIVSVWSVARGTAPPG